MWPISKSFDTTDRLQFFLDSTTFLENCIHISGSVDCTDKKGWVDTPLAEVHKIRESSKFFPCNLEWSNLQMLMSHKSCIRFTAASAGPVYFAVYFVPSLPDTWYYLRIAKV